MIKVYPIKYGLSEIAWPLTIFFYKDDRHAISIITHELAHVLIGQNPKMIKWNSIHKRYEKYHELTRDHLLVHAICMLTAEAIFKKRAESYLKFERFWEWDKWKPGKYYKRSWDIVAKKPESIIKEHVK